MTDQDVSRWAQASAPTAQESPIFVLGFPRSGTTLLETMLDAHPQLSCMDERAFLQDVVMDLREQGLRYPADLGSADATAVERMRRVYWNLVQTRARIPAGRHLVDKNPLNMLRLPLIKRMFPNAKIVLALRHPCDVVLSNYMQMFRSPAYVALCATIETIASGYARAFDFWSDQSAVLMPDVLQIRHEDTVDDVEGTSRRLSEFLGIPWDAQMVAFHDRARNRGFIATPSYHQVVEPINRKGVGRWERYRDYFGVALPRLQPFLDRWEYAA